MKELIKIEEAVISNEKVNAVDARELYKFLGSRQEFSTWIKARLEKNRFEEGFDFLITLSKNNSQGRPAKEYTVSLEVAKHICMMENTDKGYEVRKYFIECEKQLLKKSNLKEDLLYSIIRASTDVEKAIALNDYERSYVIPLENKVQEQAVVIEEQTQVIEEAKPKVEFYDTVTMPSETVDLADAAKLLNFKGVGRNNLYKLLRQWKVIDSDNRPYQKYVNSGYFKLVQYTVPGPYGRSQIKFKTVCYQKGLDLLLRVFLKRGYERLQPTQ